MDLMGISLAIIIIAILILLGSGIDSLLGVILLGVILKKIKEKKNDKSI